MKNINTKEPTYKESLKNVRGLFNNARPVVIFVIVLSILWLLMTLASITHATISNPHPLPPNNSITSAMMKNGIVTANKLYTADTFTMAGALIGSATINNVTTAKLDVTGATSTFNGIGYNWTSSQGSAGTALTNDGAGNLSWSKPSSISLQSIQHTNQLLNVPNVPQAVMATSTLKYSLYYGSSSIIATLPSTASPTITGTFNVVGGSNEATFLSFYAAPTFRDPSSATVDGIAVTPISINSTSFSTRIAIYSVVGLLPGTHTFTVTITGGSNSPITSIAQQTFYGVNQTNPFGNSIATTTIGTIPLTSTTNNSGVGWFSFYSLANTFTGATVVASGSVNIFSYVLNNMSFYTLPHIFNLIVTNYASYYGTAGVTINPANQPISGIQFATALTQNDVNGYMGFITATTTTNTDVMVKFCGVLSGFTGLVRGTQYYLGDTLGSIGINPGTINKPVGNAIDSTTLRLYCN